MRINSFKTIESKYFSLRKKDEVSRAEEWLLDNFYIIEREAAQTQRTLSGIKKGRIRKSGGRTVILDMAKKLVSESGGRTDESAICDFLCAQQEKTPLMCDELWLFPAFIKLALIDAIAELCMDEDASGDKMGILIGSISTLNDIDWSEKFSLLCFVDKVLCENTDDFEQMSSQTKEEYRRATALLAKKSGKNESDIAYLAAQLAKKGKDNRERHIGYYLVGDGRIILMKSIGLARPKCSAAVLYPWSITAISTALFVIIYDITLSFSTAILSILPAVEIAVQTANFIFGRAVRPVALPRLSLKDGIPTKGKTMIVYPVLLSSESSAAEICEKLEVCREANRDENLLFAVLGDLRDGDREENEDDARITGLATEKILRLNEKYSDAFFLFIRKREYNKAQNKWMGKERKRGALCALCSFLRGGEVFPVSVGNQEKLRDIRYIITLDGDTVLPIGGARKLVGAAMHPLNLAQVDEKRGIVTHGYGIIKPKISIDVESASKTMFSRIFAGQGGIDPYSAAQSDIYMDVFGEAIFTGKGIFDIDAFYRCTTRAIPDNTVLSHDLLEGSYLRCGFCSAAEVYDSYPASFASYAKRQHRWIRGDWQLLGWLMKNVKNASGEKVKNPLSPLSRWKITDNLRRSINPSVITFLLIFPCVLLPHHAALLALVALLAVLMPLLLSLGGIKVPAEKHSSDIIFGVRAQLYSTTLAISLLAYNGVLAADAAIRTIIRILFTKKNTLQWVTAADAERGKINGVGGYYRLMSSSVAAGVAAVFIAAAGGSEYFGVALILGIIWAFSPFVAYFISRENEDEARLSERSRAFLLDTAQRTWRFFADYATEQDNFLPPDNLQLRPYKGVAHRTSPTNIGLYMLCTVGARDLNLIETEEMEQRISKTLETIEKLEKWRGHLLNWYNTKNLRPLYPRYVSTVDSGNFICYLMAVCSGVSDYGGEKSENLVMRMKKIISETKFDVLFEKSKRLFSIGYNIEENRLSASYYDMLASEARQTVFLSVANGEIKPSDWFRLSRTLTAQDGYKGLVSWTGTMFEYFMPLILMRSYKNTLIDESMVFALRCQKKYGRKRRIPWGVSESGFFCFDVGMNYQYKAFGVPGLGLRRGLAHDSVIAPYATQLALMREKRAALLNLLTLKRNGIYGEYGFYEAADYTPSRVPKGAKFAVVKSYMAHHQGMGMASIVNVLCDNVMQKRFEQWPQVKAALPLLKERVPVGVPVTKEQREKIVPVKITHAHTEECVRRFEGEYRLPPMHALSNGVYSVLLDSRGCGVSSFDGVTLGRKRPSPNENGRGFMITLRGGDGTVKSAYDGECVFSPHMAQFRTNEDGVESNLCICVMPEESAELRRITLINRSGEDKSIEVTAFTDVSLTSFEAEISHSAFAGLFVKTFYEDGCLFAKRNVRNENDKSYVGFLTACAQCDSSGEFQYETDRAAMLGRGGDVVGLLKKNYPPMLGANVGNVLDPCLAMRIRLEIKAGESASVDFVCGISENMQSARKTAYKYRGRGSCADVLEEAYSNERMRPLKLAKGDEELFLNALSALYYGGSAGAMQKKCMEENNLCLRELWKMSISAVNPIVVLEISDTKDADLLERVLRAHKFWRYKGMKSDLAVICSEAAGYNTPVFEAARERAGVLSQEEGIYLFGGSEFTKSDRNLLIAASTLYIDSANGGFEGAVLPFEQVNGEEFRLAQRNDIKEECDTEFFNGYGGFERESGNYIIMQSRRGETPAPWVNVIANEVFGTILSESGGGCTWYKNSREMRLTDWHNDACADIVTERLVISAEDGVWSPQAGTFSCTGAFKTVHAQGYTAYSRKGDIDCTMTVFVPRQESTKIITVQFRNNTQEKKKIEASYIVSPALGVNSYETHGRLKSHAGDDFVFCENAFSGGTVMFLSTQGECFARIKDSAEKLKKSCGEPVELVAAQNVSLEVGEEKKAVFLFGAAESEAKAQEIIKKLCGNEEKAFEKMKAWRKEINAVRVQTGNSAFDYLVNGWLLYQTTSCRIWGRSAFYQSGGAYGFRDQLQDVLAVLYSSASVAREQIIRAASHQFVQGDVLHWWHEGNPEKGVRTRFSDDRLWLAYVTAQYIEITGDATILDESAPYIMGPQTTDEEPEKYFEITERGEEESIYEHCKRAIDVSLRFGSHGLPLMGGGDWNDGMNAIGAGGEGESVWLAWFLRTVLLNFAPLCRQKGENDKAALYEKCAQDMRTNANENAWDGEWFMRAFYDDGTPVGSSQCAHCRIDSISQSWSVISHGAQEERGKTAVSSAVGMLVDDVHGIIKLLTPPFEDGAKNPGYISSYLPGVRENGGQYTHGAVWLAISAAMLGENELAWKLFEYINPINHTKTQLLANIYKTEPYVVSADIYSAQGHEGRGGWSWYTGASSWMYKLALQYILGFKKSGDTVLIKPCLPAAVGNFKIEYRFFETDYIFNVQLGSEEKNTQTHLVNDKKKHEIAVTIVKS